MMANNKRLTFIASLILVSSAQMACDIDIDIDEEEETGESMESGDGEDSGDPGMESGDGEDSGDDGMGSGDDGVGTADVGDPGTDECDWFLQDCAEGLACYYDDEAYVCAPHGEGQPGDDCLSNTECDIGTQCNDEGFCAPHCDTESGLFCDPGVACIPLDEYSGLGLCEVEGFGGDGGGDGGGVESCDDPSAVLVDGQCLLLCDPLIQDCDVGDACLASPDLDFVCVPQGEGQQGDACEYINGCEPGLACVAAEGFPMPGGCTPFCDLGDPLCPDALECVAFYAEGEETPGNADVGLCVTPG